MQRKIEFLFLRAVALVCVCILAFGCYEAFGRWKFLSSAKYADGTVVALHEYKAGLLQPEISFRTTSGETVSVVRKFRGTAIDVPRIGAPVTVVYLASAPGEAVENSFAALWGATLILLIFGVVGLAVSFLGMFLAKHGGRYKFRFAGRDGR